MLHLSTAANLESPALQLQARCHTKALIRGTVQFGNFIVFSRFLLGFYWPFPPRQHVDLNKNLPSGTQQSWRVPVGSNYISSALRRSLVFARAGAPGRAPKRCHVASSGPLIRRLSPDSAQKCNCLCDSFCSTLRHKIARMTEGETQRTDFRRPPQT